VHLAPERARNPAPLAHAPPLTRSALRQAKEIEALGAALGSSRPSYWDEIWSLRFVLSFAEPAKRGAPRRRLTTLEHARSLTAHTPAKRASLAALRATRGAEAAARHCISWRAENKAMLDDAAAGRLAPKDAIIFPHCAAGTTTRVARAAHVRAHRTRCTRAACAMRNLVRPPP
jgi:hypothetical protein